MIQLSLLQDSTIKKSIKNVPINQLSVSEFNPRYSRNDEDINHLAQRISRNGFEITRALWVYQNGNGYKVFAGGTRLEAAKRAGCKTVPVVLHEGLTEDDIVKLAEEDNENDEYHLKVSPVDMWANYAWLAEQGWDDDRIGKAKNVSDRMVRFRKKLHRLPDKIKKFGNQGNLSEAHFIEIDKLEIDFQLLGWLTKEDALEELSNSSVKLTVRQTGDLVTKWKEFTTLAKNLYAKLSPKWQSAFIEKLGQVKARSQAEVQSAYNSIIKQQLKEAQRIEEELARQRSEAEAERLRIEHEQERNRQIQQVLDGIILGDFIEVLQGLEDSTIDTIITDPPYSAESIPLYGALAEQAARVLKPGGSLLVMCGQLYQFEFQEQMRPHLNYQWMLAYLTPGGQSPQIWPKKVNTFWKPVLWFVKGEYQGDWQGDVIKSDMNDKRFHHWGQSESGTSRLVERFSQEGDLILDPFLGGGTTGLVSIQLGRRFIGIDKDENSIRTSKDRIFNLLQEAYKNGS